jgi:ABC-type Fe3+ transport system permease subunit
MAKRSMFVIFVLAASDFGVPALLRVRVFTTEIFTAFAALYAFARAMALALPLLVLALFVALISVRLAGDRLVTTRRGFAGELQMFDGWRPAGAGGMGCVVLFALLLPIAILAREARRRLVGQRGDGLRRCDPQQLDAGRRWRDRGMRAGALVGVRPSESDSHYRWGR